MYRRPNGIWAPWAAPDRSELRGGALSFDGGLMLQQQVDHRIGLSVAVAAALHDPRNQRFITHELRDMVAHRLYGLRCGYEDLNDHTALRRAPLMQTAVGTGEKLGGSPTLCRMEHRASRADVVALNRVLVDQFIAAQATAPDELILDIDASDIPLHGDQEKSEFHAYYDHYCYCRSTCSAEKRCSPAFCATAGSTAPKYAPRQPHL